MPGQPRQSVPRPWQSVLLRVAMGGLWIYGAIAPAAAQNPTGAPVEMWYGMRRVDGLAAAAPPAAKPVESTGPIRTIKDEALISASTPPPVPVPPKPIAMAPSPPRISQANEPVETYTPLPSKAAVTPPPVSVAFESNPTALGDNRNGFYGISQAQLLLVLIAVMLGPLTGALLCWLLLRRSSRRHREPLRVDFSSPPIYGVPVPLASTGTLQPLQPAGEPCQAETPERRPAIRPAATPEKPATAAEAFDPGPSYAAVRQQNEDAHQRHEAGILQCLVDQNIRLREQMAYT